MPVKAGKPKVQFICQSCGAISPRWMGQCKECDSWNTLVEEVVARTSFRKSNSRYAGGAPVSLSQINFSDEERTPVESQEFNRVLGGGIVAGSVILIGGDPGIGKSTIMLQEAVKLARKEFPIIYVTGEESARQTKLRARRLGVDSDFLYILPETDLNSISNSINQLMPSLIIVDSIQTIFQPAYESSPGSISQVRECALEFSQIAKKKNIPIFLIGHVTKEGYLAGPKVLEHMVDVVLSFEGDRDHFYRILRSVKNRFGSTREIAVFEMTEFGLKEITNPSALFLSQRKKDVSGSSVICTIEGTRPYLVEIQALVTPTNYGLPQRTATGIEAKRLSLLLAVLEKRIGLGLGSYDVFVNAAGGVRIDEPSADLGILVAIASSFKDEVVNPEAVIVGEVGLGGEIRAVPQIEKRIDEAFKLGFKTAVIPKFNTKGVKQSSSLKSIAVEKVEDALEGVLS